MDTTLSNFLTILALHEYELRDYQRGNIGTDGNSNFALDNEHFWGLKISVMFKLNELFMKRNVESFNIFAEDRQNNYCYFTTNNL